MAARQKIIMRGGLGLLLECLNSDHVDWLQRRLTLTSKGFQDKHGQTVSAFSVSDGYFWVPRFFDWMDFWPKIQPAGWQWVAPHLDYDLKSLFTPDPTRQQPQAIAAIVEHLKQHSSGIGVLPTGIGKTMIALEVGRHFQTPICVLIHKGDMVDNWVEHAGSHLGIPPKDVAVIKEDSYAEGKPVTICSIQTLLSRDLPQHFYDQFGFVAADECISGDALIETDLGRIPLERIPDSGANEVLCFDKHLERWTYRRILRWMPQGTRRTMTVTTETDRVRCTPDHLFLTTRGWIEAQHLKAKDLVYAPVSAAAGNQSRHMTPVDDQDASFPTTTTSALLASTYGLLETQTDRLVWTTSFQRITCVDVDPGPGVSVFDLEVEEHHNFVANGLLVHNCHHYGAAQWSKVISRFPARYRLGISADPIRDDGLDPIVRWNFGKVAFGVYKRKTGQQPLVCMMRYPGDYDEGKYHDWRKIGDAWMKGPPNAMKYAKVLAKDESRNSWLVGKIIEARAKGRRVLIFTKLRGHLEALHDEFVQRWAEAMSQIEDAPDTTQVAKLWGGMKDRERQTAMIADVTFTTYGFSKEATNLPHKDTLVLATPAGDPLQTIGRLRDKGAPDRKPFLAIDPFEGNDYSFKKAMQRSQAYAALGIEVKRISVKNS